MKYCIALLSLLLVVACKNTPEKTQEATVEENQDNPPTYTLTKEANNEFEDLEDGGMMLLGPITKSGLTSAPYKEWFQENLTSHTLDTAALDQLQPLLTDVKIKVFMGTWCEDSQREVPALYKILDATNFNYENFSIVALSHDKDTPNGLEKGHRIEYVPTILFIKNGDTLNRIVEYAHATLEQDMLTILQGKAYTPAYSD